MGFKDLFKKDKPQPDPLRELTLSNLKVGYFLDYDLKTWEVTAYNVYDFSEGDKAHEWQLKSSEETVYLELESDDEDYWSWNRKIPSNSISSGGSPCCCICSLRPLPRLPKGIFLFQLQ